VQADFEFEAFAVEMGGGSKIPFVGAGIFLNKGFAKLVTTSPIPVEVLDFGGFGAELQLGVVPGVDDFLCHHFSQKRFLKGQANLSPNPFKVPFRNSIPVVSGPPLFVGMRGGLTLNPKSVKKF
jgi:hypothetical protein